MADILKCTTKKYNITLLVNAAMFFTFSEKKENKIVFFYVFVKDLLYSLTILQYAGAL